MIQTVEAIYDGSVLRLSESLPIEPNTRVRVQIESLRPADTPSQRSFLQVARELSLEGPSDWSANLDEYLNADLVQGGG